MEQNLKGILKGGKVNKDVKSFKQMRITPLTWYRDLQEKTAKVSRKLDAYRKQIQDYVFQSKMLYSDDEATLMSFLYQKRGIPKKYRYLLKAIPKERIAQLKKEVENVKAIHQAMRQAYEKWGKTLSQKDFEKAHLSHIWQKPSRSAIDPENIIFGDIKDPNVIKRKKIPTLADGIRMGMKPVTTNIFDLTMYNVNQLTRRAKQHKLLEMVDNLSVKLGEKVATTDSNFAQKNGWQLINRDEGGMFHRLAGTDDLSKPVYAHPDFLKATSRVTGSKRLFESDKLEKLFEKYELLNTVAKTMKLTGSFFHPTVLFESGMTTLHPADVTFILQEALKTMFNKQSYNAFEKNFKDVFGGIKRGLQIGTAPDVAKTRLDWAIDNAIGKTKSKVADMTLRGARAVKKWNDQYLWDNMHTNFKAFGYEQIRKNMMRDRELLKKFFPSLNNVTDLQVEEEASAFINQAFGGLDPFTVGWSPKAERIAQAVFLAPDWLASTTLQALSPFGIGAKHSKLLRSVSGMRMLGQGVIYLLSLADFMNYIMTGLLTGKPRLMEDNEKGHRSHILIGKTTDGRNQYMRLGKQFRELYEYAYNHKGNFDPVNQTLRKLGGKLSPNIQLASQILTGRTPAGYENYDTYNKEGLSRVGGLAKTVGRHFVPFSLQNLFRDPTNFRFAELFAPVSKGMGVGKAHASLKEALNTNNLAEIKNIYYDMLENNVPNARNIVLNKLKRRDIDVKKL